MPRHKTHLQNHVPYHINSRCINRDWFQIPLEEVWEIFSDELYMANVIHNLQIHSFVLMNNHYHLIASTPESNLSSCMHRFSQRVSKRITKLASRINQTFAGRYYKTILQSHHHYLSCYKYVYRNPVSAGITERVEDYTFSSLSQKLGGSKLSFPLTYDPTLFDQAPEACLDWLNTAPHPQKAEAVKYALKRPFFKPLKCRKTREPLLKVGEVL